MNSDFSFKKFQWKKIIAFALCVLMLLPQTAVFAAGKTQKMEIVINEKGSSSGNASGDVQYEGVVSDDYSFVYTGKTIRPVVYVIDYKGTSPKTISKKYYTVKYGKFNSKGKFNASATKAAGVYYVQVTFKGKYKAISPKYMQFAIRPQAVKIKSVKVNGKKKATVTWNKLAKATVDDYEIRSSARTDFKNDQRIESGKVEYSGGTSGSTWKLSKVGYGNKNYVRVRAYKRVNYYDKWGQRQYISLLGDWSKVVTVTFK